MSQWPGDPTAAEKAAADQRLAVIRDVADQMIAAGPASHPDRTAAVIELHAERVVRAVVEVDRRTGSIGEYRVIGMALAAELLYRLTTGGDS